MIISIENSRDFKTNFQADNKVWQCAGYKTNILTFFAFLHIVITNKKMFSNNVSAKGPSKFKNEKTKNKIRTWAKTGRAI